MAITVGTPGLPGAAVSSFSLQMGRIGGWTCDLVCSTPSGLSGAVTIGMGPLGNLVGTVIDVPAENTVTAARTCVRVVGGANGLRRTVAARDYDLPSFRNVFEAILSDAGETAAASIASSILSTQLDHWTMISTTAGAALRNLVELGAPGTSWRVLTDGTIWVGEESWPVWPYAVSVVSESPADRTVEIGMADPIILPGYTLNDRKIDAVKLDADSTGVRATLWFLDET